MFSKVNIKEFQEYLEIEKERQLALQELSEILGIDITFSNEEMRRNAEENFVKSFNKKIEKELSKWMKSTFS